MLVLRDTRHQATAGAGHQATLTCRGGGGDQELAEDDEEVVREVGQPHIEPALCLHLALRTASPRQSQGL